jgi:hypothetical protein
MIKHRLHNTAPHICNSIVAVGNICFQIRDSATAVEYLLICGRCLAADVVYRIITLQRVHMLQYSMLYKIQIASKRNLPC